MIVSYGVWVEMIKAMAIVIGASWTGGVRRRALVVWRWSAGVGWWRGALVAMIVAVAILAVGHGEGRSAVGCWMQISRSDNLN